MLRCRACSDRSWWAPTDRRPRRRRCGRRSSSRRPWTPRSTSSARTSRCPKRRLRDERQQVPEDAQWMVNAREDVDAALKERGRAARGGGADRRALRARGRPRRRDPRRGRGDQRRPDRGRQQGHDRRQALPAGQRAEQGLSSRSLQRDDHPDYLALPAARARARSSRSRARARSARSKPAGPMSRAVRSRCASTAAGLGLRVPRRRVARISATIAAHVRGGHRRALVAAR